MKTIQFITFILLLLSKYTSAQFSATTNSNAAQLAQNLAGPGVQILNPVLDCGTTSTGFFTATGTNLGLGSGIVLSTGGPNEASLAPNSFGAGSGISIDDADLATITIRKQYDVCKLEFDIVPNCTQIDVNYVFASVEYPTYVCSNYNDAFGFFISGPGIVGNQNIAVVPGSSSPVSINNVNSGIVGSAGSAGGCPANTNSNFYVDNAARTSINSYGGFTTLLTASSAVQACSIYHVKLVIADIQDGGLNSAIFLKLQGVTCNPL
ncbi:MAG: choice-of-anchor L domain-containing protein, partial [Bacteroidia bacterium]|nr:choice-of-anchor L domain-containing protein [Bacteroidia bacterium]